MIRRIISIDGDRCNGCGLCASACHEGAIGMVDGRAKLLREDYCDGLGDCLPACPMNAISFVEREAPAYDEAAVLAAKLAKEVKRVPINTGFTCPGTSCKSFQSADAGVPVSTVSQLANFPVQIQLLPTNAACFDGADLLIAADCTAYAYADFHREFMAGRVTMVGCPKLDNTDYTAKLTEILKRNDIRSVTVVRMTVPCCGGLSHAVKNAVTLSGKQIPLQIVTIDPNGTIIR